MLIKFTNISISDETKIEPSLQWLRFIAAMLLKKENINIPYKVYYTDGLQFINQFIDQKIIRSIVSNPALYVNAFNSKPEIADIMPINQYSLLQSMNQGLLSTGPRYKSAIDALNQNVMLLKSNVFTRQFIDPIVSNEKSDELMYNRYMRQFKLRPNILVSFMSNNNEFNELRSRLTKNFNSALKSIVRSSGQKILNVSEVKRRLGLKGVHILRIPLGFDGFIDESGRLYNLDGLLIDGYPNNSQYVTMNNGDHSFEFKSNPISGTAKQYYTVKHHIEMRGKKFVELEKFISNLPKAMLHWRKDLYSDDLRLKILGTICEIGYKLQTRIGSEDGGDENQRTYGISTLLKSHVKFINPNLVELSYLGKDKVQQAHWLPGKSGEVADKYDLQVMHNLNKMIESKQPNDYVFTIAGVRINEKQINQYLQALIGSGHFHYFRHAYAIMIQDKALDNNPFEGKTNTLTEVDDWYNRNVSMIVAEKLGHRNKSNMTVSPSTSRENYMSPILASKFFKAANVKNPLWLQKLLSLDSWDS
jgi:hypothetical protein